MNKRTLTYALMRPVVLLPGLVGLGLLFSRSFILGGLILVGYAVLKVTRILADPSLDDLLRLRDEKLTHGITRRLTNNERAEILAIDRYVKRLLAYGADPALGQATMNRAWDIIAAAGEADSRAELEHFRQSLPPLEEPKPKREPGVAERIAEELQILRAANKEAESVS